jgi:ElaB/YqjD/DUF883 family membrane-anchored ribosome-binding protein
MAGLAGHRKGALMNNTNIEDPQPPTRAQERAQASSAKRAETSRRGETAASHKPRIDVERLREVGKNLGGQVDDQVHKRPYVVIGAAAGAGFIAGSILGSRLGQVLLATGVGYAAKHLLGPDFGLDRLQAGLEKLTGELEARTERGSGRS